MAVQALKYQYELLKSSRKVLFNYCETLKPVDFIVEIPSFGHGSIRNLLVHVANAYIHWLPNFGLGNTIAYADVTNYPCIADIYGLYDEVDVYVADFIKYFSNDLYSEFEHKLPTRATLLKASALSVFTHTITHEVHHKGQIISISRNLGYTPPDTDFIRF